MSSLTELSNHGLAPAADALVRSTDHVLGFFKVLRRELAFFLGCANLHHRLEGVGQTVCIPGPTESADPVLTAHDLVDPWWRSGAPWRRSGTTSWPMALTCS